MKINAHTHLFAVFGNPISHSLSPQMHNQAFATLDYNGIYLAFRIEEIEKGMAAVRTMQFKGVSITIPHKVSVMKYLDQIDASAVGIGAVNTITNHNGFLRGSNSDGIGAIRALEEKIAIQSKHCVIIGAGGAARAIGYELSAHGVQVTIVNRSISKGEKLAADLKASFKPLSDFKKTSAQILINTTPVGMTPYQTACPLATSVIQPGMVVMDIIYNPLQTQLLKSAQAKGCLTIDGLAMFVYQGGAQFELWTGLKPPLSIMRASVCKALEKRS